MNKMKIRSVTARLMLFFSAIVWGSSFIVVKDTVDVVSPFFLIAMRFTAATVLLGLLFMRNFRKNFTWDYLWRGAIIGFMLFAAYGVQTLGIVETTPGKNAFLSGLYCVMVPFLFWILGSGKPDRYNLVALGFTVVGAALVTLNGNFSVGIGDSLTILAAFFYAAHIVSVGKLANDKNKDVMIVTVLQFFYAAIYSWIAAFVFETPDFSVVPWPTLAYLSVFCTALALLFQNIGQKLTTPASASIILSLESVFGILFSIIMGREGMTLRIGVGFALIFIAVIISETKLSFLKKNKHNA